MSPTNPFDPTPSGPISATDLGVRNPPAPPAVGMVPVGGQDTPPTRGKRARRPAVELVGSAVAALATIWLVFSVAGLSAQFGLVVCWFLLFLVIYGVVCHSLYGTLVMKDRLATVVVWGGALTALTALVAVIGFVVAKGAPVVFARFPHFLFADMSQQGGSLPVTDAGVGAAIMGTIEQVGIATLITVPLGILTATYLIESRSLLSRVVRNVVDAMTGTPSIIAGIFLYLLIVLPLAHGGEGKTGLTAGLALSVLMLPLITRAALEVIIIVPGSLREAALALGAPQWRVILRVVLPTARVGLITAAILGVARTAGETAEVLFTAGGNSHYNLNPVHGYQDSLPLRIFELIGQPSLNAIREAWGVAFVLVAVVLALFTAARVACSAGTGGIARRRRRKAQTSR
jgi:phosphate transport system permease protein